MGNPVRLSVFLPVYNAQEYLVEALDSIAGQSFGDFEVVMADGGSSDFTGDICRLYAGKDRRFRFVEMPGTTPPERFNEILRTCDGEYIAIAHSDDIQHKDRFKEQVCYMDKHRGMVFSGTDTFFWLHDPRTSWATSYSGVAEYPRKHEEIVAMLPFWWCFANPTLIFRVEHLRRNNLYMDTSYKFSSDYLFYWHLARTGASGNLDKVLLHYRHSSQSEGPRNRDTLEKEGRAIRLRIAQEAGILAGAAPDDIEVFLNLRVERDTVTGCPDSYEAYTRLFALIVRNAESGNRIDGKSMAKVTGNYLGQIQNKKQDGGKSIEKNTREVLRKVKRAIKKCIG